MHRLIVACAAVALVGMTPACTSSTSPTTKTTTATASTATVTPVSFAATQLRYRTDNHPGVLRIEIASTPEQSERGLGFRDALAEDGGMLFDLGGTRVQEFWMKGMRFALDFIWIDEDRRVVGITAGVQPQPAAADAELRRYAPPVAVRYVLEINAGAAARLGIATGTELTFELPPP